MKKHSIYIKNRVIFKQIFYKLITIYIFKKLIDKFRMAYNFKKFINSIKNENVELNLKEFKNIERIIYFFHQEKIRN